jgi:CubicO group peptidase (beta-lactamase class C family)
MTQAKLPATLPEGVEGSCDERFAEVATMLGSQIASGDQHGVAFAAYHRGEPVIDIWGGRRLTPEGDAPWQHDTMAICFSTTKGVTATALHMAMERNAVSYDTRVAEFWPEFAVNGKDVITIRHLLTHEAGCPQIRDVIDDVSALADWDGLVGKMEGLTPLWEPGTANGYHAITFGPLVGETLRRIDGRDVPTFLAEELAGPLELDGLYIGTPESEHSRIAPLLRPPGQEEMDMDSIYQFIPTDSILWKALAPRGDILEWLNTPEGMSTCLPSASGAFTARSLAKLYAAWERGGELDGVRILSPETIAAATTVQNTRNDLVIMLAPHWRLGFMSGGNSAIPVLGPNADAYGHVGAGGTLAGCDPSCEVSFALVYDLFADQLLGAARSLSLVEATVRAAQAAA